MERFAFDSTPRSELMTYNFIEVVSVERLTHFQHYKVGYVNDVVNRTHARAFQTFNHPIGRRSKLNVRKHPRRESGAKVGRVNSNFNQRGSLGCVVFVNFYFGIPRRFFGKDS